MWQFAKGEAQGDDASLSHIFFSGRTNKVDEFGADKKKGEQQVI